MVDDLDDIPLGETEVDVYDVAQICLNGHVVNDSYRMYPQHNSAQCSECGQKTVTACPKCKANIQGRYHASEYVLNFAGALTAPPFCRECGSAYPWTEARLSAVRELERLDANERGTLDRILDDLVSDTPRTPVATLRFKQLVLKAGPAAMEEVLSD